MKTMHDDHIASEYRDRRQIFCVAIGDVLDDMGHDFDPDVGGDLTPWIWCYDAPEEEDRAARQDFIDTVLCKVGSPVDMSASRVWVALREEDSGLASRRNPRPDPHPSSPWFFQVVSEFNTDRMHWALWMSIPFFDLVDVEALT